MKILTTLGVITLVLLGQAINACENVEPARIQAIKRVLTSSHNPQKMEFVRYLSDDFFAELACRLSALKNLNGSDKQAITSDFLAQGIEAILSTRNQSDALMMILNAMQSANSGKNAS